VEVHVPVIETSRLRLREFQAGDAHAFQELNGEPEVRRYLGGEGKPLDQIDSWCNLSMLVGHWVLRGYGFWAVELQESRRFIGRIGLFDPDGWPGLELAWVISRAYWGNGLATEGAMAVRDYAFNNMDIDRLISTIHPENLASIRVAEKLGMRLQGTGIIQGEPRYIYMVTKPDGAR
jgi:RimJ/RimL family protein N-acetyltransferase